nr:hypothetical protein [Tanacetum cinerariifolium]
MGLEIKRIHACPNDCMLYRDEYKNLHAYVTCKTSRYKKEPDEIDDDVTKNRPLAKLLWYFPIIPRLKRLFENKKEAKLLRWHFDQCKDDGKLRHVTDSPQWRKINNKFPEFAKEIRNIRFGLSSDRINPFENMSSRYSPKQPGNDIDVYLYPLINDMKTLWKPCVEMYDVDMKEKFRLHAMIFCTINDFPAYGNLSGYSTKGKHACPICEDETSSRWLDNCKKTMFKGHRRSLPSNHPYCGMSLEFDGRTEYGRVRTRFSGDIALSRVSNLNTMFGKGKGQMYFPPSFFDVKVHLASHIVSEIKACGPIHLHYMFPFERYMGIVKGYVRNRSRPEGSIVKGYASEEVIDFYTNYLEGVK